MIKVCLFSGSNNIYHAVVWRIYNPSNLMPLSFSGKYDFLYNLHLFLVSLPMKKKSVHLGGLSILASICVVPGQRISRAAKLICFKGISFLQEPYLQLKTLLLLEPFFLLLEPFFLLLEPSFFLLLEPRDC